MKSSIAITAQQMPKKESLELVRKERSTLTTKITNIREQKQKLNCQINSFGESISRTINNIDKLRAAKDSLIKVLDIHGEDSIVRLKKDIFKSRDDSNWFKNILHSGRYKNECQAAATLINVDAKNVSAGKSIEVIDKEIKLLLDDKKFYLDEVSKFKSENSNCKKKLDSLKKQYEKIDSKYEKLQKEQENRIYALENFGMIYQSNAGCKALNSEARKIFGHSKTGGSVNGSKVIEEYQRVHGDNIFTKGNSGLKHRIKAGCSNLNEMVNNISNVFYKPSNRTITTYRGQGMTKSGVEALIRNFKAEEGGEVKTAYKLGQFFSSSTKLDVAKDFANRSLDDIKVTFIIKGNSSNTLYVPNGLSFDNDEGERLYSPLANFRVTNMSVYKGTENCQITLEEIQSSKNAQLLPY